jgi:hypothetical protein
MSGFEVSHGVTLFTQHTNTINSLWTVYVAATFAAAGYGFSSGGLSPITASAITFGFIAFALGNWSLLKQALRINLTLRTDLIDAMSVDSDTKFKPTICCLAETANPFWVSRTIHIFIDVCVIIALWSHVSASPNWAGLLFR